MELRFGQKMNACVLPWQSMARLWRRCRSVKRRRNRIIMSLALLPAKRSYTCP